MLNIPTIPFIARRKKQPAVIAPAPLTLVAASYDENVALVTMQFDRAIDISGFVATSLTLQDGDYVGAIYDGHSPFSLIAPDTIRTALFQMTEEAPPGVKLTVSSSNGIVASDDGGTWEGCTDLELPFGS